MAFFFTLLFSSIRRISSSRSKQLIEISPQQNTIIMIQAEYHDNPRLVPQSTSLVNFTSLTGGMVGIAAAGAIFDNKLSNGIARYAPNLPSNTAADVRQSVAVIYTLTGEDQAHVIHAYSEALGTLWRLPRFFSTGC